MTKVGPCLVYLTRICHTIVILCHTAHLKQEAYSPVYLSRMSYLTSQVAPRLPPSKLHIIRDMIESQSLGTSELAEEAECNQATIINIRANLRQFGSVYAPPARIGRKRTVTPLMIEAHCEHLSEKPDLYLDEMAVSLWDEFRTLITTSSIKRAVLAKGWSKKKKHSAASERAKYRFARMVFA